MAGQQEARLNLVLSAKDEASKVVEEVARNIRSTFEGLNTALKEALNPSALVGSIREIGSATNALKREVESSFNAIRENADSAFSSMARQIESSVGAMRRSVEAAANNMSSSFDRAKIHMEETATAAKHIKESLDFAGLQLAGQMLEHVGQVGVGFFLDAAKSAADFDQEIQNTLASMKSLDPTLQINARLFDSLKNKALELGTKGFFSANQVAQAMNTLARQGIKGEEAIKAATETVHNAAAANFEDLEHTANVVSDIFHEFGEQIVHQFGGNIQKAFQYIGDNMTSALHRARLSMDDYLNTLKYVGPLASHAGWSLRDVSEAIALLAEHGIKGSQAGTTLRRMLTNLTPQTKKAKEAMQELGLVTEDGANVFFKADGRVKSFTEVAKILHDHLGKLSPEMQTLALKTIFGQWALAGAAAITNTNNKELKELTNNFGKAGIATDVMKEKSKGFGAEMRKLSSTFETFKKDIGEHLKAPITAIIEELTKLMKAFMNLPEPIKKSIIYFGAIASVVALVGGAFMSAIGGLGLFIQAFKSGWGVIAELIPELGLVEIAIAALVLALAGLAYAWSRDLGHIREKTKPILDWLGQQFKAAMNKISQTVQSGIRTLQQWWAKIGPDAQRAFNRLVAVVRSLSPVWKAAWEVIKFVVKLAFDSVVSTIRHAWGVISGVFQLFVHLINGQWKKAWNDLKQIVFNALMLVLDFFRVKWLGPLAKGLLEFVLKFKWLRGQTLQEVTGLVKGATKMWDEFWSYTKKLFGDAAKALGEILQKLMNTLSDLWHAGASLLKGDIKGFWSNVKEAFSGGKETAVSIIKAMLQAFDNLFGGLPGKALRWATNQMNSFISGIKGKVGEVLGAVRGLLSSIDSAFGGLPGRALSWGLNMMRNFYNGIVAFVGRIKDKVMEVASWIKDHLGHFSPAKKGPLSTDDKWFPNMMKMFIAGIEAHRPGLQKALGKVAMDINANLNPTSSGGDKQPLTQQLLNPITQRLKQISQLTAARHVIGEDPFSKAEPSNSYDRRAGHSRNIPPTISLYDRYAGHSAHHVTVNIQIEGRSKETDRQLINQLTDQLGRKLRTHVPMHIG